PEAKLSSIALVTVDDFNEGKGKRKDIKTRVFIWKEYDYPLEISLLISFVSSCCHGKCAFSSFPALRMTSTSPFLNSSFLKWDCIISFVLSQKPSGTALSMPLSPQMANFLSSTAT